MCRSQLFWLFLQPVVYEILMMHDLLIYYHLLNSKTVILMCIVIIIIIIMHICFSWAVSRTLTEDREVELSEHFPFVSVTL